MLPLLAPLPKRLLRWARHQPLLLALAIAATITAGLGAIVLAPLVIGSGAGSDSSFGGAAPRLSAANPPPAPATRTPSPTATPTPWPRRPRAPSPTPEPTATPAPAQQSAPTATATPTARPTRTPAPTPTATPTPPPPLYVAEAGNGLEAWGGPNWLLESGVLVNDGGAITAQPWITAPAAIPVDGTYAVEAEFRVLGLAAGVCQQTFGVVAVPANGQAYLGGGLFYGCQPGGKPLARITDVSVWTDGYNQDRELSSAPFDPGSEWHTLRLEVEPGRVRLLVDGEVVLDAADPSSASGGVRAAEIGLWSQGVKLAVRRIAVVPLPAPR